MTDIELGWVAGIIDGEGSVLLSRHNSRVKFRSPSLSVTSTDKPMVDELKRLLGGQVCNVKLYKSRMKPAWIWHDVHDRALATLALIAPHLRCPKKRLRAHFLVGRYKAVTLRTGRYDSAQFAAKVAFEEDFFKLGCAA